jgi:hypothetical protein
VVVPATVAARQREGGEGEPECRSPHGREVYHSAEGRGQVPHAWTSAASAWDLARLVQSLTLRWLLCLLTGCFACMAYAGAAQGDEIDTGASAIARGKAAQAAHPPDLSTARAAFESAAASTDDRSAAEALFLLGELDEAALQFASAMTHYDASVARLPSNRYAPRAITRAADLRNHAEGGFAPLARLETVRRSADLANSAAGIDALAHDAEGFPPGRVRVEARMLAAEAYIGRLHRPDVLTARQAVSDLVTALVGRDDLDTALEVTHRYKRLAEPSAERNIQRRLRRRPMRLVAMANLVLVVGAGAVGLVRMRRPVASAIARLAPMALAFAAFATLVGGFLASTYESSSPLPFAALLAPMFGVFLSARAWSASGSARLPARVLRGAACFTSIFAVAFLALDRMDPMYLQGFGL